MLLTIDGETLETTREYPFYELEAVPGLAVGQYHRRWTDAIDLQASDLVWRADGTTGEVESVQVVAREQRMYNLTVDVAHTFFVGDGEWLVHNAGPCAWTSPAGLVYDVGSREGDRVHHIFEHLRPNPTKPNHSVFSVESSLELLDLVDEAWSGNRIQDPTDSAAWIADIGRVIGTNGETKIRIIIRPNTTNEIITAYPWQ